METIYAILLAILVILSSIYYFREFLIGLLHMSRHRREALPVQSDQVGNPVGTCGKKGPDGLLFLGRQYAQDGLSRARSGRRRYCRNQSGPDLSR